MVLALAVALIISSHRTHKVKLAFGHVLLTMTCRCDKIWVYLACSVEDKCDLVTLYVHLFI